MCHPRDRLQFNGNCLNMLRHSMIVFSCESITEISFSFKHFRVLSFIYRKVEKLGRATHLNGNKFPHNLKNNANLFFSNWAESLDKIDLFQIPMNFLYTFSKNHCNNTKFTIWNMPYKHKPYKKDWRHWEKSQVYTGNGVLKRRSKPGIRGRRGHSHLRTKKRYMLVILYEET